MSQVLKTEWDSSYSNGDNFVWYPHEEVIRFVAKYIKKKVDLHYFKEISTGKRVLDFGCGIGRHVFFLDEMELEPWGVDISHMALQKAKEWAEGINKRHLINRFLLITGVPPLPFDEKFFDFAVSHGVFDSMSLELAKQNLHEVGRVLNDGGFFYLDLISGDDDKHYREYEEEELVKTEHEKGTVQSYFNHRKILELVSGSGFQIEEAVLVKRESVLHRGINARYHLVLKKVNR